MFSLSLIYLNCSDVDIFTAFITWGQEGVYCVTVDSCDQHFTEHFLLKSTCSVFTLNPKKGFNPDYFFIMLSLNYYAQNVWKKYIFSWKLLVLTPYIAFFTKQTWSHKHPSLSHPPPFMTAYNIILSCARWICTILTTWLQNTKQLSKRSFPVDIL